MTLNQSLENTRAASRAVGACPTDRVDTLLRDTADRLEAAANLILRANAADLAEMAMDDPKRDRLALTEARIADMAAGLRDVGALPSPLWRELSESTRPNGMTIRKVSVPMGVIAVVYEARPNVTTDVYALCLKAGSACVLRGGHQAARTNRSIMDVIHAALRDAGLPEAACTMPEGGHEVTAAILRARGMVDLCIPRGGRALIDYVRDNALVPVIETGAGVCHTYLHASGDTATARDLVLNAKTRRVSVCNALDCLILDRTRLTDLAAVCYPLQEHGVEIHADPDAYDALRDAYPQLVPVAPEDFGREWLDYKLTVKTVDGMDEALRYISAHGSRHSECIVAEDRVVQERFLREVDAACVYANVSTAFTDGGQYGMGAEIGISTQKLHARGPMALPELCTYKYIVTGSGQTRK